MYSLAPVAELVKRSWIKATDTIEDAEKEVCSFLGISSPEETPKLAVNFRQTKERGAELNTQIAWVKRVEHLAKAQKVSGFHQSKLTKATLDLLAYAMRVEDIMHVPPTLLDLGVHFVIVPHLPGTYVDGAAIYLDGNPNQPVVAITLRYDRIDAFWFTLMHELAHIILEHEGVLDERIFEEHDGDSKEDEADRFACEHLVDPTALSTFAKEVKPYFSKSAIERFAQTQERAPGIVLGQLQYKGVVRYQHLRSLLVKARPLLEDWIDVPAAYP